MPYHGNYQDNLDKLLGNIQPKYAIITNNKTDNKTIKLLDKYNVKTYITSYGDILVTSNGESINITQ